MHTAREAHVQQRVERRRADVGANVHDRATFRPPTRRPQPINRGTQVLTLVIATDETYVADLEVARVDDDSSTPERDDEAVRQVAGGGVHQHARDVTSGALVVDGDLADLAYAAAPCAGQVAVSVRPRSMRCWRHSIARCLPQGRSVATLPPTLPTDVRPTPRRA